MVVLWFTIIIICQLFYHSHLMRVRQFLFKWRRYDTLMKRTFSLNLNKTFYEFLSQVFPTKHLKQTRFLKTDRSHSSFPGGWNLFINNLINFPPAQSSGQVLQFQLHCWQGPILAASSVCYLSFIHLVTCKNVDCKGRKQKFRTSSGAERSGLEFQVTWLQK